MIFYHRTKKEVWCKIQKEGILFGVHESRRYTYLAPDTDIHSSFGDVLLEVEYEPKGPPHDNYGFNPPKGLVCTQFSVFEPIPVSQVRRRS